MFNNKSIYMAAMMMSLSACTATPKSVPVKSTAPQAASASAQPSPTPVESMNQLAPVNNDTKVRLERCLAETKHLSDINREKYREQIDTLYRSIKATQYYASISNDLSNIMVETITPLYQFRVNDACNTISQSLLAELKKGAGLAK
ncbi:hypothetical protein ACP6OW_004154 [Cronobacter turicensis]|uniref:hypothetical protein n=1 Tax=Cronobacter turicensis TaxID=413502 RepID=UPI000CFB4AA7|nr:hypothetical protein [Cronobacter turicensis]EKM0372896.1 hypothetical protein [Cronobacter turicensis]EKM0532044.1 hypothetical protein [Cronobacter turicensis]ELY3598757.1 hypothetical protein [Cronobacter turicensis]ELY5791233.1 hypothetical protein [Cronobacter turicensis]NUW56496.1 hypothetical protein [Cronobacter turicensis]